MNWIDNTNSVLIRYALCAVLFAAVATSVATAADWPQWRGPERKAVSKETGLLQCWPEEGPELAMTIEGIGKGPSSPVIARGRIFVAGHINRNQMLFCFSTDGRKLWEFNNGPYGSARFGAQSSALVDGGLVYILSETGRLTALDFNTGKECWNCNYTDFNAPQPKFLYADSLIIHGEKLICMPGGEEAPVVALDKSGGKIVWKSSGFNDQMAYCSGIVATIHDVEQYLALTEIGLISIDVNTGGLLWRHDAPYGEARNSLTPIVWGNHVFADSGRKGRAALLAITRQSDKFLVNTIRETDKEDSHLGGFADLDGRIYGHNGTGWVCIDMQSGKELFCNTEIFNCSTIYADNRFYCMTDRGVMYLIEADNISSRIVSHFKIPNAGQQAWARPAIADGILYLRKDDKLFLYAIKK